MKFFVHSLMIALGLSCIAIAPVSSKTIANSKHFGVAPPACEGEAQLYLNICASRWAKTSDFLRSLIYDEVYSRIPEARKSQLKAIEKTWNSYRDIHCQELSAPFQKGSIYPLLYFSCRARVTNARIADLQGTSFSQITSDVTTQRLAKILKNEKMINSAGQRQWLQYQVQQCQFEALGSTETSRAVKQCRDRLAEARLMELEAMLGTR